MIKCFLLKICWAIFVPSSQCKRFENAILMHKNVSG